jgi:hypothetical protein
MYTREVYIMFQEKKYSVWTSGEFNPCGIIGHYWGCPDIKIYRYGEELLCVFGVYYGITAQSGVYNLDNARFRYGLIYKDKLHLSDEYPVLQYLPGFFRHEWPKNTEEMGPLGYGYIHAGLYTREEELKEV